MPGNNALRIRLQAGGRCASEKGNDALEGGKGKPPLLSLACLQGDQFQERVHMEVEDLEDLDLDLDLQDYPGLKKSLCTAGKTAEHQTEYCDTDNIKKDFKQMRYGLELM